jgi:uncharacterized BrkB/YihY/UPF0761 family membrane protein
MTSRRKLRALRKNPPLVYSLEPRRPIWRRGLRHLGWALGAIVIIWLAYVLVVALIP